METVHSISKCAGSPIVCVFGGFFWGFMQTAQPGKDMLQKPVKSLISGIVDGALFATGAFVVAKNIPENSRWVYALALAGASGLKVYAQWTQNE